MHGQSGIQGLGKSGLSGETKLQDSAAVLAGIPSMEAVKLNPHLAVFIERCGIAAPVVKLRGAGVGTIRHFPGFR